VGHARALRVAERPPNHDPQASSHAGQAETRKATSSQSVTQELRETACLSLFAGREAIGHVAPLGARFEAYLRNDTSLGVHDTVEAALAALLAGDAT
jgi:hypothetical protein